MSRHRPTLVRRNPSLPCPIRQHVSSRPESASGLVPHTMMEIPDDLLSKTSFILTFTGLVSTYASTSPLFSNLHKNNFSNGDRIRKTLEKLLQEIGMDPSITHSSQIISRILINLLESILSPCLRHRATRSGNPTSPPGYRNWQNHTSRHPLLSSKN